MLNANLKKIIVTTLITTSLFACNSKKEENESTNSADEAMGQNASSIASSNAMDLDPSSKSNVSDRVFFAYDSADLNREAKAIIDAQAHLLKNKSVTIEGHCDDRGTSEYNMALGHKRANAVKKDLIKSGVADKHIKTVSYGKSKPEVEGDNERAYQQNRRAVLVATKK